MDPVTTTAWAAAGLRLRRLRVRRRPLDKPCGGSPGPTQTQRIALLRPTTGWQRPMSPSSTRCARTGDTSITSAPSRANCTPDRRADGDGAGLDTRAGRQQPVPVRRSPVRRRPARGLQHRREAVACGSRRRSAYFNDRGAIQPAPLRDDLERFTPNYRCWLQTTAGTLFWPSSRSSTVSVRSNCARIATTGPTGSVWLPTGCGGASRTTGRGTLWWAMHLPKDYWAFWTERLRLADEDLDEMIDD